MILLDGEKITDILGCLLKEIIKVGEDNNGLLKVNSHGIMKVKIIKDGIDSQLSVKTKIMIKFTIFRWSCGMPRDF